MEGELESLHKKYADTSQNSRLGLQSVEEDVNPFTLPDDGQVFQIRDRDRLQKEKKREQLKNMKIWAKSTMENEKLTKRIRPRDLGIITSVESIAKSRLPGLDNSVGRNQEKENLADFIAKKREMFLVQMSLDTKRAEIQKLEKKAAMKEEALKRSELMLEQDAIRFDRFLKANDKNAHDAIKRQELETKDKQEKVNEYKKLTADRTKIETDIAKVSEQLAACTTYKMFLEKLVPEDWKQEQAKLAAIRSEERGKHAHEAVMEDDDEDSEPMYFKDPDTLLRIFADLETRNLFLIQNCQVTEESLEELKQKFAETQVTLSEKNRLSNIEILNLKEKIAAAEEKVAFLKKRSFGSSNVYDQEQVLSDLSTAIKSLWQKCGFGDSNNAVPLEILSEMERHLEGLMGSLSVMDTEYRASAEHNKEEERRVNVRKERKNEQDRMYEERMIRTRQRAMHSPIKKATGKPVMFRSAPLRQRKQEDSATDKQRNEEDELLKKFFTL